MIVEIPIDVWDPGRGGAERYLLRLVRGLAARGHRARILCLRADVRFAGEAEVEELRVPRWPRWRRELAFARAALARRRSGGADVTLAVRHAIEADVYQPHGGPFRAAVDASLRSIRSPALRLAKRWIRRARPTTRVLLRLDRRILLSPGLITVSLSRRVENDFLRVYPDLRPRFERIYNGVDLEEFHGRDRAERARELRDRFAVPPDSRIALLVGHKFRPKGLSDALEALITETNYHLLVVGGGRPGPFRREARRYGVESRVRFVGAVSDVRPFYAGSDVLVLPTYYDPCSLTLLEALACGTPVITTTANGAGELITWGREGFVVPPDDRTWVALALEKIAAEWDRFHRAAAELAPTLSFTKHLDRMEEVLARAAEERRARGAARAEPAAP